MKEIEINIRLGIYVGIWNGFRKLNLLKLKDGIVGKMVSGRGFFRD